MDKISIVTQSFRKESNSVTIKGLTREETIQFIGAINGFTWLKIEDGRMKTSPCHTPLPDPINDEMMLPFWRKFPHQTQKEMFNILFEEMSGDVIYMPHFTIQSLCGYDYSPENYIHESNKLISYGFIQLRSKRSEDGRYWEMWHLPGIWSAKGDLKKVIDEVVNQAKSWEDPHCKRKSQECFNKALEFLRVNASFGTLDVSIQRLC